MNARRGMWVICVGFAVGSIGSASAGVTVTDLGTLGGNYSEGFGVNAAGNVVGVSYPAGNNAYLGVLWSNGGGSLDLGGFGGTATWARGINASGQIAGYSYFLHNTNYHAFLRTGTNMADLGTLGSLDSQAFAVNASGVVAGASIVSGNSHAFKFISSMQDLGTLSGNTSFAYAINTSGVVAGKADNAAGNAHAVTWTGLTIADLSTLGGLTSQANGVNDSGVVVGQADLASGAHHAFSYIAGHMNDLSTLGGSDSEADAINANGLIVGQSEYDSTSAVHAFIDQNGVMTDLNSLLPSGSGMVLRTANAISDNGFITGDATVGTQLHAYVLALPEPAVGVAVMGVMMLMRRRTRVSGSRGRLRKPTSVIPRYSEGSG